MNRLCEFYLNMEQGTRGEITYRCTEVTMAAEKASEALSCARVICSNCRWTDVTSQVAVYRGVGSCIGGYDGGLWNNLCR
jgi:hypothetical protein